MPSENVYHLIGKSIAVHQESRDTEGMQRLKEAFAIAELLIQHGVPVDGTDLLGNTALIISTGCSNGGLVSNVKFARCVA